MAAQERQSSPARPHTHFKGGTNNEKTNQRLYSMQEEQKAYSTPIAAACVLPIFLKRRSGIFAKQFGQF
jgi:hypothetical protein